MSKFDDSISDILYIDNKLEYPEKENLPTVVLPEIDDSLDETDRDHIEVKNNLKDLISKGNELLNNLILLTQSEAKVGYFDAAKDLIQTLANVNEKILMANEKHQVQEFVKESKTPPPQESTTIFLGTMDQIDDLLGLAKRANIIDHVDIEPVKPVKQKKIPKNDK